MSSRFDAVLFDFSGTLFDDATVLTPEGVRAQAGRRGVTLDGGQARRLIEVSLARVDSPEGLAAREGCDRSARRHREVWTALLASAAAGFLPGAAPQVLAEAVYACLTDPASWRPYPDTAEVLRALHAAGLRLGVVSNIGSDIRPAFGELLGESAAAELIGSFALSCEHGSVKPEPGLFRAACEELGVAPQRALFVGDDPVKDGAAVRFGMAAYILPDRRGLDRPRGLGDVLALARARG